MPSTYAVTPADVAFDQREVWLKRIRVAFASGLRLLQLQLPLWPVEAVRDFARELLPTVHAHDAQLVIDGNIEGAQLLGIGVQLSSEQCLRLLERPLPWRQLIGVSCHDASQLAAATRIRADFAALPLVTRQVTGLGFDAPQAWSAFQSAADGASLPVYAAGGLSALDTKQATRNGAQGIVMAKEGWSP